MAEKKGRGKIAAKVEEFIRGPIEEEGYLLWDVDFYKEGTEYNLLVTIEHPNRDHSVDLEDCEKISHRIGPILDEADPIEGFYYLEVSSPGIERELRTEEHILAFLGARVEAKLFSPKDGKRAVRGTLLSLEESGAVRIAEDAGEEMLLEKGEISRLATLFFEE